VGRAINDSPEPIHPIISITSAGEFERPSVLRAIAVLRKRWWEVLSVAMVVLISVTIYTFKAERVYQATARLDIEAETPMNLSAESLYRNESTPADETFLLTQTQVLRSDNLAWETIQQLKLADDPSFTKGPQKQRKESIDSADVRGRLVKLFDSYLGVNLHRNTHIVEVSFESTDRDLAARVVNALINNYIEYNFHTKYDATRQASGWMEQQLDELKAKVEKSQEALVNYERANSIVNVNDKQSVAEQRLSELSSDLTRAQSDRAEKESLHQLVKSNEAQIALLAQDHLLETLEQKVADVKTEYIDARTTYGPNFPKVVRLQQQIDEVQLLIQQERHRVVERIQRDYEAAVEREKLLEATVAQQKFEVGKLNQLLIQHNILKRDSDTNQQLYDNLLQRLKDATVTAGLRATNIHVVDKAVPPATPVRPKKALNVALGLLAGIILGTAFAFLEEQLEQKTVKTMEDVQRLVGLPSLGLIPLWAPNHNGRQYGLRRKKNSELPASNGQTGLAALEHPASSVAESYRALRTSIMFSTSPKPPQVVLVTSGHPKEGKTATAVNLASLMAQTGSRVLLVDCDLRIPGASKLMGISNSKGLSGILTGAYSVDEALQEVKGQPGLWALPSGPPPPNPAELLSSPEMQSVMQNLRQRFDHLVIDSPPLLLVTDAAVLSPVVDGVMLVVSSGSTPPAVLIRAQQILHSTGARILGVLVNKADLRRGGGYGYGYNYYNGYYYSDYNSYSLRPPE